MKETYIYVDAIGFDSDQVVGKLKVSNQQYPPTPVRLDMLTMKPVEIPDNKEDMDIFKITLDIQKKKKNGKF